MELERLSSDIHAKILNPHQCLADKLQYYVSLCSVLKGDDRKSSLAHELLNISPDYSGIEKRVGDLVEMGRQSEADDIRTAYKQLIHFSQLE